MSKRGGVSGICNNRVVEALVPSACLSVRRLAQAPLQRFAYIRTFEYLFAMANEIAIVDGEDIRKRAGALRRFL
jgi:hypothetical protein